MGLFGKDKITKLYDKAFDLADKNNHEECIKYYNKIIEINSNEFKAWRGKGLAFSALEKEDEAIICFDKALEINPNDHEALKGKQSMTENKLRIIRDLGIEGQELYGLKKYEEAMQCFKKVLKMDAKLEIKLEDEQIDAFEGMIKLCLSKLNKSQNEKTPQPQISSSDDDPLKILKTRLAKGEITLKEFNEIKENLV